MTTCSLRIASTGRSRKLSLARTQWTGHWPLWYGAPLGTLYVRTASGYVNVWQKFADSGNTTDWRNTMGGVAQTYELTLQSAATSTGNGTVAADVGGYGTLLVELSGTFVATVTFEGSQDGTNYYAILGSNMTTGAKATTATGTGGLSD